MLKERGTMRQNAEVIEGTAQEVIERLARVRAGERVRVMIGRPSLTGIARRLQQTAAANGMTQDIHDELLATWKNNG